VSPKGVRDAELKTGWHIIMPWNNVHNDGIKLYGYTHAQTANLKKVLNQMPMLSGVQQKTVLKWDLMSVFPWRIIESEAAWDFIKT
jgi:hypothetical protein